MNTKIVALVAGLAVLGGIGSAGAAQDTPDTSLLLLTTSQMDTVTAGAAVEGVSTDRVIDYPDAFAAAEKKQKGVVINCEGCTIIVIEKPARE